MEFQSVDEAHMEELVASEIPAAQRVIVVGAERPYLACLIFLKALRNSENLDADVIRIALDTLFMPSKVLLFSLSCSLSSMGLPPLELTIQTYAYINITLTGTRIRKKVWQRCHHRGGGTQLQ